MPMKDRDACKYLLAETRKTSLLALLFQSVEVLNSIYSRDISPNTDFSFAGRSMRRPKAEYPKQDQGCSNSSHYIQRSRCMDHHRHYYSYRLGHRRSVRNFRRRCRHGYPRRCYCCLRTDEQLRRLPTRACRGGTGAHENRNTESGAGVIKGFASGDPLAGD